MENASKALLMAGGVLISILIIGLLVLMINQLGSYQKEGELSQKSSQIAKFNMDFEKYLESGTITGADVVTLINKVVDYNQKVNNKEEIGNSVDYSIGMTIIIDNLNEFDEKYAYTNLSYQDKLFGRYATNGSITIEKQNNNNVINQVLKNIKSVTKNGDFDLTSNQLKELSVIYNFNRNNLQKVRDRLEQWGKSNIDDIVNNPNHIETIKFYGQYDEFKSSKFTEVVEQDKYASNGQLQKIHVKFYK